jgi:hypothetical protein
MEIRHALAQKKARVGASFAGAGAKAGRPRARSLDQTPRAMQRPAASRGSRTSYHVRRARNVMRARLCPIFAVARRASKPAAASFPIMAASL